MKELMELKEKLMDELKDYNGNSKFSKEDAEAIKAISASIDHICNIVDAEDGYSERGFYPMYMYDNRNGGSRNDGGSYARGRGSNAKRDSLGRYSSGYDYGYDRGNSHGYSRHGDMAEELRRLMAEAPNDQIRMDIQRLADNVEQM